ncbi:MAG: hypothetical protein JRI68_20055 [Deltaproteobacteria bacterium]|nr:hypothetical protein [Deltaproteobacteria bacterium]
MWVRCMMVAALFSFGCGGNPSPPPTEPPSPPVEEAPPPPVEPAAPAEVEPAPEPAPEPPPDEDPEPPPSKPEPPPEPTCAELAKGLCQVTEGCEYHSTRGCLEQAKPRTLDD